MTNHTKSFPIRLHSLASFDRGAKVRWALTTLELDFEDHLLDRERKEHESAEFLALNPMGRVPVLEIDGGVITESGAICAYLADRFLDRGLAPALASPERGIYQQWLYFAVATLDTIQSKIMIIEDIPAGEVRTEKETALLAEFEDSVAMMERTLSKSPYLTGKNFTLADICVGYHLYVCTLWPELDAFVQKSPQTKAYLARLHSMPSAVKANVFSFPK